MNVVTASSTTSDRGTVPGRSTEPVHAPRRKGFGSNITPMIGYAPKAISKKAAAELLTVSEKTIERLINRGELPGFRVGWKWRIMLADLEAYVDRQQASERRRIGK
ncbi:MAG: helix-turn-helix domain-containing protein [Planctomycetota bacterium]